MTMDLIEKVARAICTNEAGRFAGPGQNRATREFGWKGDGAEFDLYVNAHWKEHVGAAHFAIDAIARECDEWHDTVKRVCGFSRWRPLERARNLGQLFAYRNIAAGFRSDR